MSGLTANDTTVQVRWDPYVLAKDERLEEQWRSRQAGCNRVLLLLGHGFDPRMCAGLDLLKEAGLLAKLDVWVLDYSTMDQPTDEVAALVSRNLAKLELLLGGVHASERIQLTLRGPDGRRVGARSAIELVRSRESSIRDYQDVIVDISALPRTLYFPLIGALLKVSDNAKQASSAELNLHVIVAESPLIDSLVREEAVEQRAEYLPGFVGGLDQEANGNLPTLWVPLLGERQGVQLERIYDLVLPAEICPVLPSPSVNPRRADDLVLEYRELLFDRLRIEPRNILYAAEQNPFEVYRQLRKTVLRYQGALAPLGGCKTAISVLSSKLMSVGALLAAFELKAQGHNVGIVHVEANRYSPNETFVEGSGLEDVHVFGLWLAGECYAK